MLTGYAHPEYARSLAEFGSPRKLPRCGGWILERQIPGFPLKDGMGCYPLFVCRDWSKLHEDLDDLKTELISLALVIDPFGDYDVTYLQRCFDVVISFKEHFVTDLRYPQNDIVSKHHCHYARKGLKKVHIETCHDPTQFIDEWVDLYADLIRRHNLKGIQTFSKIAFAKQLGIPGMVVFRAVSQDVTVGLDLWYVQGEVAYGHLVACSPIGYKLRTSYALKWHLLHYFADKVRWLDLGGGAGIRSNSKDGLSQFKEGWSTGTRPAYFCGRIFNKETYWEIVRSKRISDTNYFPAYRKGEFE